VTQVAEATAEVVGTETAQPATPADGVKEFVQAMHSEGFDANDLIRILDRALVIPPGTEAFDAIALNVRSYLGEDGGTLLLDWLTSTDMDRLESDLAGSSVDPKRRGQAERLLRRLRSVYLPGLAPLFQMWQERPGDWKRASRYVYWDKITSKWLLQIILEKYDGTVATWEGPPASVANVTRFLLATLNILDDRESLDSASLQQLVDEYATFHERYVAPPQAEADGPEADASSAPLEATAG